MLAPLAFYLALPLWLGLTPLHGSHDPSRLFQLLVLAAASLMSLPVRQPQRRWATWAAASWVGVSCLLAAKPSAALRECLVLVGLGVLILQVSLQDEKHMRWLLRLSCAIGAAYACIFFLTTLLALVADGTVTPLNVVFGFENPRHLNHTQTVLIPLALGVAATDDSPRWRKLGWTSACLAAAVAAFLLGRATMLAVVIAMVTGLCLLRRDFATYGRLALVALVAGFAFGLCLRYVSEDDVAGQAVATGSWQNRLLLWRAAVDDAGQSLFGVGPMHFSRVERGDAAHPHNFYLQTAAELGWPAAVALLAGVLLALTAMARRVKQTTSEADRLLGTALWVTMVAIALDACLSGNLVMPVPQMWVAMAIGLALGWYNGKSSLRLPASRLTDWMRYLLAASMIALTLVSAYEFSQPHVRLLESQYRDDPAPETYSPRYWRDGWF